MILKLLLGQRADFNAEGRDYSSALKAASYKGHDKIIKLLLSKGAHVNCPLFDHSLCDHSSFNLHTPRNPSPMMFTVCGFYRHHAKPWLPFWRNTFRWGYGGHG
jgi:ankyrin repeat protein